MEIHGANDGCDLSSLKVDNFDPNECNEEFTTQNNGNAGDLTKRYKCLQCPYLSNSRTQFLYHKQFHRPRDASFKCMYCSYNVSRRHLLHQHLRVHHMQKEVSKSSSKSQNHSEFESSLLSMNDINTINMPEIPLVWVLKGGNFQKMFKCRWCPHVNMRKINIQEHEKMHQNNNNNNNNNNNDSDKNISDGNNSSLLKLHCLECNYTCNNAGVLASHVKVHQGFYGEIRSLVDPTRSEADQIRELQSTLRIMEPEVVIKEENKNSLKERKEFKKENICNESLSSQPENAYCNSSNVNNISLEEVDETKKMLKFCNKCPARFFFKKELQIHSKFHAIRLPFMCSYCSYTARQRPHLLAHLKVHSDEYQRRTTTLVGTYSVSSSHPQPKVALLAKDDSDENKGIVWIVLSSVPAGNPSRIKTKENTKPLPKLCCDLCPGKFFKSVALQYHKTLHGSSNRHKCKYCDYAVKTYGNLMKHQFVHEKHLKTDDSTAKKREDQREERKYENLEDMNKKSIDASGGEAHLETLFNGSPEFIYPTYIKNGKLKEKKYKCHKCPSAFEKRDQYRVHLSLHGSKQKFKCEKCDYSVKYYTNYIQHMKKHENHDRALKAKNSESEKKIYDEETLIFLENRFKIFQGKILNKMGDKKYYNCPHCPYATNQRHIIESHVRKHYCVSKIKSGYGCQHCDFYTSQEHCMREHKKLHFGNSIKFKAEAYIKCEKMELWCCEENGDWTNQNYRNPPNVLTIENILYVNLKTGEFAKENSKESSSSSLLLMTESFSEKNGDDVKTGYDKVVNGKKSPLVLSLKTNNNKLDGETTTVLNNTDRNEHNVKVKGNNFKTTKKLKSKIMKRWRGKNWKCKKCPHAFGKKDQYLRHAALHGSNQKHNCDICDYSVKFYTNYVQHMRMHQTNEPDKIIFVKKNCSNADEKSHEDVHITPRQNYSTQTTTQNSKEKTSMEKNNSETDVNKSSIDDVSETSVVNCRN
ncbi:conserved hypothetical protein [Pediculus humanus corporis]|uniref:C2H2-type domain-containing protein n=1 Tax=Pediculus humanus subsp. corporis TaxID=121224 RepID=E0VJQ6_PEDHC|nr:uncharacterized protein Phum_PHUM249050 [Pediculus humanus corporis]EEB13612.1 conserved hypothetical protein [Pediculus humanus corporis]